MRIRRLRLSGFKSFVDPAELLIEPGLTGIVGPNGCGKSNLLEAIRWVMGEASARSLRGGGMEDVIFAGTASRPARDFAEVQMQLDAAPAPGQPEAEVEVVRRIERGAGSAYRLNGRDARARDVALLFADAATGAHSPALVSQGRIAAVIGAKPAERRAMLEEAAGIAGLHVRRKDAEARLRATEANLDRAGELADEMEARATGLRRQARAAERYRTLSDAIRVAEARLVWARWRDAARAVEDAERALAAAEAAVQDAARAQADAAGRQSAAQRALDTARERAVAAREQAGAVAHRLEAAEGERKAVDRRLAEIAQIRESLARDLAREDGLALDAANATERLGGEIVALGEAIAAAEAERPETEARLAAAEFATRDADVALSRAQAALASELAEQRVADAALATARGRLARAEADHARAVREAAGLPSAAPLAAARDAAAVARTAALRDVENMRAAIAAAEAGRDGAGEARDTAQAAAARARAALAALDGERQALGRALAAVGATGVVAAINVQPGYEQALAAALGPDLELPAGDGVAQGWRGSGVAGRPLAPGLQPLAAYVAAPAELASRLAQIGVADRDDDQPLAPGQRLVTRDGRLRRWDGLVTSGTGASVAARFERGNRLAALDASRPALADEFDAAECGRTAAAEQLVEFRRAADQARAALQAAEARARKAAQDEDAAAARIERLAGQHNEAEARVARYAAEREEAASACAAAQAAVLALPDRAAAQGRLVAAEREAIQARDAAVAIRTAAAAGADRLGRDRERQRAARAESAGWKARAGDAARRVSEMRARTVEAERDSAALGRRPAELAALLSALGHEAAASRAAAETAQAAERSAEVAAREADAALAAAAEASAAVREDRAGVAAHAEAQGLRRVEMGRIAGERFGCPAPVLPERVGFASAEVGEAAAESRTLDRLTADRERLGPVNLVAADELATLEAERTRVLAERDELAHAVHRLRGSIGSLNREGRQRLLAAFEAVDGHFRRLFTTLFGGGQAHLALIDSDDPLEAGLEIMAQPPGKKLAALTLLSGGEQALTAVALIFGLFLTNPAPICVLDEVDAPLDDANVERFCDLLHQMTRDTDTRYLVVTHNAVTMSRMDRLFGVTMVERGVSRLVSVDLGGAEELLAAE